MTRAAFYTPRTWFAPPSGDQQATLEALGCPAAWLAQEVFCERADGHYAWVGLVGGRPAGALVGRCVGDALHVHGWLAPSLRKLGLATEALDGLASALLVELGHVPVPDDRPFSRRHSPRRIVVHAHDHAAARVAERCGARLLDGDWILDLVGHTGLDRSPQIDGRQVARLLASLRPADGAALEPIARAHRDRLQAAIETARRQTKPTPRYQGVQALVDHPPELPASEADVQVALEHAWAARMDEVLTAVRRRLFTDAQIDRICSALDDSHLPAHERCEQWADIADWLGDYQRVRRG